ncbi:MAG: nitroreductase [Bdellovibrionales bacterium]|nr:nitroreductase [Bdellovibrionales bacterium]
MELVELIRSRRTIHNYKAESIAENVIEESIEMAIWAPNHKHTQPWLFYRLGPNAREALTELAIRVNQKNLGEDFNEQKAAAIAKKFNSPAEIFVVGMKTESNPQRAHEDYASLSCAIQNISLYLWEKGIGTKWSTGDITRHKEIYKIIDVAPDSIVLEGFLWMGIAEFVPKAPPKTTLDKIYFQTK